MFFDAQRASNLVIENEDDVDGDILAGKTSRMIFPDPEMKEFILRTFASRPYSYSAASPQRMYAMVKRSEFRLAGAVSIDKIFL